jgi:hypothetical protein
VFAGELEQGTVDVLPLVDDEQKRYDDGWCTYVYKFADAPDLEMMCGGLNSKTPRAGAIWRQGNLLHFGFEQSPAEMNEAGDALLINSIVYIARFTQDRPIAFTPSVFTAVAPNDRSAIERAFKHSDEPLKLLAYLLSDRTYEEFERLNKSEREAWRRENLPYLHADAEGRLVVDEEARSFGAAPNTVGFLEKAITALADSGDAARSARTLLARYVPDGPGAKATTAAWNAWLSENHDYLFFNDAGGYRWYIDPLAKKRGVQGSELRGPLRADQ